LTSEVVGSGGRVLPPSADFADQAAEWITNTCTSTERWTAAVAGAREFVVTCNAARERASAIADDMLSRDGWGRP
jgi:hypothetical protein